MVGENTRKSGNRTDQIRPRGYKTFFMLNSAEHEIFSGNKYENANNTQLCLARKNLHMLIIWDLLAWKIPCSAELSMKKL